LAQGASMQKAIRKTVILLCAAFYSTTAFAAMPAPAVQSEVVHLLAYLEQSDCQFFRNGTWHSASDARAHLQRKYDYLLDKGLVARTEDFIKHGASQSSISKKPYQVKCPGSELEASVQWLRDELQRYRQGKGQEVNSSSPY
jgi:hypothetical protein